MGSAETKESIVRAAEEKKERFRMGKIEVYSAQSPQ